MSLIRVIAPVLLGVSVAALANGNAAGIGVGSNAVMQGTDSTLRCDSNHLTAQWFVSEEDPGYVESVLIGNIANSCDGGTLYVFTNANSVNPPPIAISVSPSTQIDVPLGLPVEDITTLTIVILAPGSLL